MSTSRLPTSSTPSTDPPTRYEAICENCSFFRASIEFRLTFQAQPDDAEAKGQNHRAALFDQRLNDLTKREAA